MASVFMVCSVYYEYNDETYSGVEGDPYHVDHIFSKEEDAFRKLEYLTKDRIESIIHEESVWAWQYALESAKYPLDPDMDHKYTDILKKMSHNESNNTSNKLSEEDMDTLLTACLKAKVFYFVLGTQLDV